MCVVSFPTHIIFFSLGRVSSLVFSSRIFPFVSPFPSIDLFAVQNSPNPGEELLNSTIDLINHFTSYYEAVKHQLQDEHTKSRESALASRTLTLEDRHYPNSRTSFQHPAKQAPDERRHCDLQRTVVLPPSKIEKRRKRKFDLTQLA